MKVKLLCLFPCLSLLSFCFGDSSYVEEGRFFIANYYYNFDRLGYGVTYKEKHNNNVELEIKRTCIGPFKFGLIANEDLFEIVTINGINKEVIELQAQTKENEWMHSLNLYEVDFVDAEDGRSSLMAYISLQFYEGDFSKLKFVTDQTYNINPTYFLLGIEVK